MTTKLGRFRNWLLTVALAVFTIGGALFLFQEQVKKQLPNVPERCLGLLPTIGLVLIAVGLLLCLGLVICLIVSALSAPARLSLNKYFDANHFDCRVAKKRDIEWIHRFGEEELRVTVDINKLRDWYAINYEIFWVIVDRRPRLDRNKRLAGYFALIPLNKLGTELVEAEKLDGSSFTREHIIHHKRGRIRARPKSIYIGGVAAKRGIRLRQFTLDSLKAHIGRENSDGVNTFFTRPVTNDGLRLVRRHRFSPVNKFVRGYVKEHIYRFEYEDDVSGG